MSTLITRGTRIESMTAYAATQGGVFTLEIKCRANWSVPVCSEMGWTEEPAGFGNGKLDGELFGINMILEPNDKKLKDYAIDIGIGHVSSFRHIAKTEDETVVKREFEFVVSAHGENAEKALPYVAEYIKHCCPAGDMGTAKITYNAEKQEELPIEVEGKKGKGKKATAE